MRDPMSQELRRLAARTEAAERRLAQSVLYGKVVEKNAEKRRVRLKLGTNAAGEDVLSPWLRWQEAGVGSLAIHAEPAIGEQMAMMSPSGTIGAGSIAMRGSYDQDHPAPSTSSDTAVIAAGAGRIELGPAGVTLIGNIHMRDGTVDHDGVDIGKTHKHTKVRTGSEISGDPVS